MAIKANQGICVHHNAIIASTNFYKSRSDSLYGEIGYIPICKDCLAKLLNDYHEQHNNLQYALFLLLRKIDVGYNNKRIQTIIKDNEDSDIITVMQKYISYMNSLGERYGEASNFDNGDEFLENVSTEGSEYVNDMGQTVFITKDDERAKEQVLRIVGYNPYDGYNTADEIKMINSLVPYLEDETLIEDPFRLSKVIDITILQNDARKLNRTIASLSQTAQDTKKNAQELSELTKMQKDTLDIINKVAKENKISNAKGGGGKSSWTLMIDKLKELDFEDAAVNYYDQGVSYGMQVASDISMKSMSEFLNLGSDDTHQIIINQRKKAIEYQEAIDKLQEDNRLLKVKMNEMSKNES